MEDEGHYIVPRIKTRLGMRLAPNRDQAARQRTERHHRERRCA